MVLGIEALHVKMESITGIERYLLLVLEALDSVNKENEKKIDRVIIFANNKFGLEKYSNLEVEILDIGSRPLVECVNESDVDIIHCTFVPVEVGVNCPVIYTLHDVGRYLYPEFMDRTLMEKHIGMLNELIAAKKCTLTTVSKASKKKIIEVLNIDEHKVYTARLYPSQEFRRRVLDEKNFIDSDEIKKLQPFFLVVGCFIPTKNVKTVIKAFQYIKKMDKYKNHSLVIVGKQGWDYDVEKMAKEIAGVIRLSNVSDNELLSLYKTCQIFISASLIEGFGLPVVEAAYLRRPVICSDIEPYREILGKQGTYFSPENEMELVEKIESCCNIDVDYSSELDKFTAENMGKELLLSYINTIYLIQK